ncbi:hypothetical protein ACPPVU_06050 [Mucilaginibacter sp. McL0603]|uniref:hypothetical protein n=1 Tax=Mucilaginibacter sp. McL0603 TaxID=3415670 RepID=UPI003CEA91D7
MIKYRTMFKCHQPALYLSLAVLLLATSCSNAHKSKLQGNWKLKSGETRLKITAKKFAMDSDLQYAEDYFVKGDTIFTSFEGNQPYSKFVVQKLDDNNLKLLSPDSTVMEFTR